VRISVVLVVLTLALMSHVAPGAAQGVRVVAVADFLDESADGGQIGAARLSADLQRLLAERGRDRMRVVAVDEVRAAMRARGYKPEDMVSPTRAAEIATAVGAEWIVTGRWLHLDLDDLRMTDPIWLMSGHATIEIRVLEAATRRIVLRDSFLGVAYGAGRWGLLQQAAYAALVRAAERIVRL
jgi:hypothetical protein